MADGSGNPNTSPLFEAITGALYGVSYGAKFASKKTGRDYTVMPLEGLWWNEDPSVFELNLKDEWNWTLMIMQPEWLDREAIDAAVRRLVDRRKLDSETAGRLRLETLEEGMSGQVLHVGPYSAEAPTIEALHRYIQDRGYRLAGKHHEIYMSDPRRAGEEKLKTIIRHPVEPA